MNCHRGISCLALFVFASFGSAAGAGQPPPTLGGTSWQLVRIQYMDDKVVTPDDRSKYTVAFGTDGRASMRIDCNRGSGSWKSAEPGQLVVGPLAVTRAMCPPGSLHDRVVKDMGYVRSYVIRDKHLFLSLMADGGIYEFEPMPKAVTGPVTYACTNAQGQKCQLIATPRQTNPPSVLVERGDRKVVGTRVPAASGAKYEGANLVFWEHQGEAQVTWMDVELKCKVAK